MSFFHGLFPVLARGGQRSGLALCSLLALCACGGGGSSSAPAPVVPPPAAVVAQPLELQDSLPGTGATAVDPALTDLTLSHLGFSDLQLRVSGPCSVTQVVRRRLESLSTAAFSELLDHKLRCSGLETNASVEVTLDGQRDNGDAYTAQLTFGTGVGSVAQIVELDAVLSPRATVDSLFDTYLANALLPELDLRAATEALIGGALSLLVDDAWTQLTDTTALFGAGSRRVSYPSRDPLGNAADRLTGLVAAPDTSSAFVPRDQVIVLAHSTGSTPGDLDPTNAWYVLANVLAAQGYLVVAADNWGRGDTADAAETYLMANRTAANSLDFLQAVLADSRYADFVATSGPTAVTIVGYSQGGHSAMALWQLLATQGPDNLVVRDVFAGGAPHNLFRTFKGVLEQVDGRCNDDDYCRNVDPDATVSFATRRILPGFLSYTDTGLVESEVIDGDALAPAFVTSFLEQESRLDPLKILLQQNSFTNLVDPLAVFGDDGARLFLYHAPRDRLVPAANTVELEALLGPV
ncbi:MAG: alpha/beta hydrolase family protein, partial [Pseudomonadales bacterium]